MKQENNPTLKKFKCYRHKKNKTGVDIIPLEDRVVDKRTFDQLEEVKGEFR